MAKRGKDQGGTIVLKRIEAGGHGHHGGAWKVAYADFVTAMMAFFLLMWLLNATTEEQRRGLADFFNPASSFATGQSGVAQPFGGRTPHSQGQMAADTGAIRLERGPRPTQSDAEEEEVEPPVASQPNPGTPPGEEDAAPPRRVAEGGVQARGEAEAGSQSAGEQASGEQAAHEARELPPPLPPSPAEAAERARLLEAAEREQRRLEEAADALRAAFLADPQLAEIARQVLVEIVPEGLRIQLLESDGTPMFATGGSQPTERVRQAIRQIARATAGLQNPLTITGHTDSAPFRGAGRTNWELSAERANAARRLLMESGIAESRLRGVTGMADREPLLPGQPQAAANRRVAITLLREAPLPR
ncbi:MAG: OmpA family protein [Roseococcus sp.]|nr:OmpA family protein [Roseococcus sp.]